MDYGIYFTKGQEVEVNPDSYTSHNTERLDSSQVAALISELPEFKRYMETR